MGLKIVTDSTSDLPPRLVEELDITVIPLIVRFGTETYRDGVDLSADEFFRKLVQGPVLPTTAAPGPAAFSEVYEKLLSQGHEVLAIHISNKLSATHGSAILGKESLGPGRPLEVLDSTSVSMGMGLLVIQAARAARAGAKLAEAASLVRQKIPILNLYAAFDTLEYLHKGGRIGRAQALLGSMLNLKPMIVVRDGEVHPLERVRTRAKAIGRLVELVRECPNVEELTVLHSTTPGDMEDLAQRLAAIVPGREVHRARFGPVLGTHTGPGVLGVGFLAGK